MDSGPSLAIVFGCLCIAPVIAVICVILLVWLSRRSGANVPVDAIAICPSCGREFLRTALAFRIAERRRKHRHETGDFQAVSRAASVRSSLADSTLARTHLVKICFQPPPNA